MNEDQASKQIINIIKHCECIYGCVCVSVWKPVWEGGKEEKKRK